jgi:myo-inositol 2-dehydrogenase / D-chiro-inositol 1-dehydrogenase
MERNEDADDRHHRLDGEIGRVHTDTTLLRVPECRLKRLRDVRGVEAQTQARKLGIPRYTTVYRELLADSEIDGVLIGSPTPTLVACIIGAAL